MIKKASLVLIAFLLIVSCQKKDAVKTNAKPERKGPFAEMTFDSTLYDFGTVISGDTYEHTFKFTNTGKVDLVIEKANGTCGCTVPEYPKTPVKPGAKGEIRVVFNSRGKFGQHKKTVFVTANTPKGKEKIQISANLKPRKPASGIISNQ